MRAAVLQRVKGPSFDVSRSEMSDFVDLGELGKRKGNILKKLHREHRKIFKKVLPKPLRRVFTRKAFVKLAPVLAIVAQVLNVIPGLGIAVGLAITAGAAAIAISAKVAAKKEAHAKQVKAEKEADAHANAAFAQSNGYFTQKYGVTEAQFRAMKLDDKLNFLQTASEDADKEAKAGQGIFSIENVDAGIKKVGQSIETAVSSAATQLGLGKMDGTTMILFLIGIVAFARRSK